MKFLSRIDEFLIKEKSNLVGHIEVYNACKKVINLVHSSDKEMSEICNELDIRSINIFYGETGTGKTTLSYSLAKYALDEFEAELYEINIQHVITSDLGKTLENFHSAYEEIKELSANGNGIVLFLDEVDRLIVDRNQTNEVSEMKRAFISFMDFLQSISFKNRITILATTNCFELLDPALKRRFSFQYEIKCNRFELDLYLNAIKEKLPREIKDKISWDDFSVFKTIAEIKQRIRVDIINSL
ncbi:AAA family ATPase [Escherichia coli]|nr:AAA family ATPase [Escherichia coli]